MSWTSYHHDYPAAGSNTHAHNLNINRAVRTTANSCVRSGCCRQQANNNDIRSSSYRNAAPFVDHDMPYPLMSPSTNSNNIKKAAEAACNICFESLRIDSPRNNSQLLLANVVYSETMHKSDVISLAWKGCLLASGGADKSIRVFEVSKLTDNGQKADETGNYMLANGADTHDVSAIELLERDFSPINDSHRYHVNCVTFFPGNNGEDSIPILASCSTDGVLSLWNAQTGSKLTCANYPFTPTQVPLRVCTFSPCGSFIAAAGDDEKIAVWKLTKNADSDLQFNLHKIFVGPNERTVMSLMFSPDSSVIVSGATAGASAGGDLRAWNVMSATSEQHSLKELFIEREAHDLGVTCGDISRHWWDEKQRIALLVTGGYDNFVKVWHMRCGGGGGGDKKGGPPATASIRLHMQLTGHTADICDCRLSNTNVIAEQLVVSASNDRSIIVWTLATGSPLAVINGFARFVRCVCFSPDDKFIASGDGSGRVALFAINTVKNTSFSDENGASSSSSTAACLMMPPPSYEQAVKTTGGKRFSVSEIENCSIVNSKDKQKDPKQKVHANLTRYKSSPAGATSSSNGRRLPLVNTVAGTTLENTDGNGEQIPREYICPISRTVMKEPVVAADGFTYDRDAIEAVFLQQKQQGLTTAVSAVTGVPLAHGVLVPNRTLAKMIDKFQQDLFVGESDSVDGGQCQSASRTDDDVV